MVKEAKWKFERPSGLLCDDVANYNNNNNNNNADDDDDDVDGIGIWFS